MDDIGAPWHVFKWGDGSQDDIDLANVGSNGWETTIAKDVPLQDGRLPARRSQ